MTAGLAFGSIAVDAVAPPFDNMVRRSAHVGIRVATGMPSGPC
jgi:hypothetical protein